VIEHLREIFKFKEMIKSWTKKELRTRYKGSFFGFLWTFINPLMQLVIYSFIFPYILKLREDNYAMFLFVALVPWNYFTSCVLGSCGLIVSNSSLVTKVYFPREVLPISYSLSGLLNMIFSYAIVFPMLIFFGIPLTLNLLWLPLIMITQAIFCTGLSFVFSSINVYFRDLEYFTGIALMALYFLTPIMYNISVMPQNIQWILRINPMTNFAELYRDSAFYGVMIDLRLYTSTAIISFAVLVFGYLLFNNLQKKFTEIL
jgi:ABC-2 type transport system permease protein